MPMVQLFADDGKFGPQLPLRAFPSPLLTMEFPDIRNHTSRKRVPVLFSVRHYRKDVVADRAYYF